MFGWLPLIGPVIDGLVSVFNKFQDVEIVKYKTDGTVDVEAMKASAQVIEATKNDLGVQICRDAIMLPGSVWCGLYLWDKIVAHHYPELVWDVAGLDGPLALLPHALLAFFFGVAAVNVWRR